MDGSNHCCMQKAMQNQIIVNQLSFSYSKNDDEKSIISDMTWEMEPGSLVALSSITPSGKATMLKLLGRLLEPTKGFVHYPSHWRVRYLDQAELFNRTVMENLRFGNNFEHTEDEIWELCRELGLSAHLMRNGNLQVGRSGCNVAMSDRVVIALARCVAC